MKHSASQVESPSDSRAQPSLEARLFGSFELRLDGETTSEPRAMKDRWLLALLLLANGKPIQRDLLAIMLWPFPDFDSGRAAANLRRGLWVLRQALGQQSRRIESPTPTTIAFDLTDAWIDVIEFDRALLLGDRASLESAVRLHRAPLLHACTEAWIESEREPREQQCRQARKALRAAEPVPAVTALSQQAGVYPGDEGWATAIVIGSVRPGRAGISEASHSSAGFDHTVTGGGPQPEPEGGAVPLESSFYIVRPTDRAFETAISRCDSIVLVKGAREIGKTSLLARGLHKARETGAKVVLTDLQTLTAAQMASADSLFLTLAETITDQLQLDIGPETFWNANRGWNVNFEKFLRRDVLGKLETPLVWALDEVDRLFGHPFSSEVFSLFRSWHNQRALNPAGPWGKFTLAVAYATEAHLFITDLNQSPFNVGTRLTLEDFTVEQTSELNARYGSPLRDSAEVERFYALVGGHPALVRRGLHEMTARGLGIAAVEAEAEREDGLFGNHLRRMLHALQQDSALCEAVRNLLQSGSLPPDESFYRLCSAGLIVGKSAEEVRLRCRLYQRYLERHLQ
jgi:Cdc6-like AAA superfamily ATPase